MGKQLGVRIPKPLAEDAEVKEGTVLNLAVPARGDVIWITLNPQPGHEQADAARPSFFRRHRTKAK